MYILGEYWGFEDRHACPWRVLGVCCVLSCFPACRLKQLDIEFMKKLHNKVGRSSLSADHQPALSCGCTMPPWICVCAVRD